MFGGDIKVTQYPSALSEGTLTVRSCAEKIKMVQVRLHRQSIALQRAQLLVTRLQSEIQTDTVYFENLKEQLQNIQAEEDTAAQVARSDEECLYKILHDIPLPSVRAAPTAKCNTTPGIKKAQRQLFLLGEEETMEKSGIGMCNAVLYIQDAFLDQTNQRREDLFTYELITVYNIKPENIFCGTLDRPV